MANAVSVEGLVAVHVLIHGEGVAVIGVEPQQGGSDVGGEAAAGVGVDDAVVVVVAVDVVGYAVVVVVEGEVSIVWEGVNGVGHAVGIAVAQAAVLIEIGDKGHAHLEVGGVADGPQTDEGTALLEVLEVVDHSFESDISASEIGDAELESGFLDAGIV